MFQKFILFTFFISVNIQPYIRASAWREHLNFAILLFKYFVLIDNK